MTITTLPILPPTPLVLSEAVVCASPAAVSQTAAFTTVSASLTLGQPAFCSAALSLLGPKSPVAPAEASSLKWLVPAALGGVALLTAGLVKFFGDRNASEVSVEPMTIDPALQESSMYLDAMPAESDVQPMKPIRGNNFAVFWDEAGKGIGVIDRGIPGESQHSAVYQKTIQLNDGDLIRQGDRLYVARTEGGLHFEVHSAYNFWEDVTIVTLRNAVDGKARSNQCSEWELPLLKDLYVSARNESFSIPTDSDRTLDDRGDSMTEVESAAPKTLKTLNISDLDFLRGSASSPLEKTVPSIDLLPPTVPGMKAIPEPEVFEKTVPILEVE